jgi:hypothetical protein
MKYITLLAGFIATFSVAVVAGPNLTPDVRNFTIQIGYLPQQHEIDDGCITPGTHNVLRFDFISKNIGDADFVVGRPIDRPDLFYFDPAHQHYHMKEFNQFILYDTTHRLIIPSKKPGFCLADVEQVLPNAAPAKFSLTCNQDEDMGITAGWADVYTSDLMCQFLVIDGIPNGNYTLVVTTNTAHAVPEDTFDDNTINRGLRIEGNAVMEVSIEATNFGP